MSPKRRKAAARRPRATAATRAGLSSKRYRTTWAVASDARRGVRERVKALASMGRSVCDDDAKFRTVVGIVRDMSAPVAVRLAALQTLQAASFSVVKFNACRAGYLAALRSMAADPNPEIRQRVLGFLSREQDAYAQQQLLEGLRDPAKALVRPEKALQLLSYDVHSEAYPVARKIVREPPNPAARREALRLLAADAESAPVFEEILRSKGESPELRRLSASALQSLAPRALQAHAREIVLDESENDEVRATSLTALAQFGEEQVGSSDDALYRRVERLKGESSSRTVRRGARQFLGRYRR